MFLQSFPSSNKMMEMQVLLFGPFISHSFFHSHSISNHPFFPLTSLVQITPALPGSCMYIYISTFHSTVMKIMKQNYKNKKNRNWKWRREENRREQTRWKALSTGLCCKEEKGREISLVEGAHLHLHALLPSFDYRML